MTSIQLTARWKEMNRINVQPVALGDGLPLPHGLDEPPRLELVSSTACADGPMTQTYIPR